MAVPTRRKEEAPKSLSSTFNAESIGNAFLSKLESFKNEFEHLTQKAPDGRSNFEHLIEDFSTTLGQIGNKLSEMFNKFADPSAPSAPAPQTPAPTVAPANTPAARSPAPSPMD